MLLGAFVTALLVVSGASAALAGMGMRIDIDTPSGVTLTLDVESSDSIENVKQKIQDHLAFLPSEQQLSFGGVTLEDGHVLAEYGVVFGSTLQLRPLVPLAFTTTGLGPFVVGAAFSRPVVAVGGFGTPSYSVTAGALPAGILLAATGALTGTPTAVGPWSVAITANAGGVTTVTSFSGVTAAALAPTGAPVSGLAGTAGLLLLLGGALIAGRRRVVPS